MADAANRSKFFPGRVHRYDWVAVAAVLVPALRTLGNLSWTNSVALGVPLALGSLFIPLAAGFTCRFTPIMSARGRLSSSQTGSSERSRICAVALFSGIAKVGGSETPT